jgi:hypothetical protein
MADLASQHIADLHSGDVPASAHLGDASVMIG